MEHLRSKVVISRHLNLDPVPLYADIGSQLNSNFHTFHLGSQSVSLSEDGARLLSKNSQPSSKEDTFRRDCSKFVQGWLYFQVLRAILGCLPDFDIIKFTRTDTENNHYITTEHLPSYLEQWLNYEMENPDGSVPRLLQAQLVLEKARHYVFEFCSVFDLETQPKWSIDEKVVFSIMILGETMSSALTKIQRKTNFSLRGWSDHESSRQGWGYSERVLRAFREEPWWCLKTVSMLQGLMKNSTIGLLYALDMRPQERPGIKHTKCMKTECKATVQGNPIELENPEPFHCPDCDRDSCKEVGPDTRELIRIINKGQIPLLRYQPNADIIHVVGMNASCNKKYVTFSHVWIDGFGNRKTNKMNQCVLKMFCSTFSDVKRENVFQQRLGDVEAPENFWIDTLAIPIGKNCGSQRRNAIRSMHEIYKNAKYTVVLDFGLMSIDKGEGYTQPAMRITLSNWMTRLWTLQEAFLSKHLYFKFSDQLYSMDRLERLFQKEDEPLHWTLAPLCRTYYHGVLEKESRHMHGPDSAPEELVTAPNFVATVWKAVQWRTTAHRQHETLSLATLFHVNTDAFVDSTDTVEIRKYDQAELNERMQKLLDLLAVRSPCAIPPGIIFVPGPRLRKQGYRWAPESWLSGHPVEPPDPVTVQIKTARLNVPHGLEVWYPGFRLHKLINEDKPMNENNLLTDFSTFHFPADRSLWQWYRASPADKPISQHVGARKQSRDLAIIATQLSSSNAREIGLLVEISREQSSILFVEILHRVYIKGESDPNVIQNLRAKFLEPDFGFMLCGERLPSDQHWCVDGRDDSRPTGSPTTDDNGEFKKPKRSRTTSISSQLERFKSLKGIFTKDHAPKASD